MKSNVSKTCVLKYNMGPTRKKVTKASLEPFLVSKKVKMSKFKHLYRRGNNNLDQELLGSTITSHPGRMK